MEAAEVGVRIKVDAIINLLAATSITLRVKGPDDLTFRDLPMTVSTPTNFAVLDTLATDFPDAGNYIIQLEATFPPSDLLVSPAQLLHVGESIAVGLC